MRKWPSLTTARAVEVYIDMISARRLYCADTEFPRMDKVWQYLCDQNEDWKIKIFRSNETEDFKRKAGVIAFDGRVTLSVDERLIQSASNGCKLSNFILAHELSHLGLDHHAKCAVVKNFQLFASPQGMANIPPTPEELEANFGAVFFQCGVALADPRWETMRLAERAFSDPTYVRKAQQRVQLDAFQRELNKPKRRPQRLIL